MSQRRPPNLPLYAILATLFVATMLGGCNPSAHTTQTPGYHAAPHLEPRGHRLNLVSHTTPSSLLDPLATTNTTIHERAQQHRTLCVRDFEEILNSWDSSWIDSSEKLKPRILQQFIDLIHLDNASLLPQHITNLAELLETPWKGYIDAPETPQCKAHIEKDTALRNTLITMLDKAVSLYLAPSLLTSPSTRSPQTKTQI